MKTGLLTRVFLAAVIAIAAVDAARAQCITNLCPPNVPTPPTPRPPPPFGSGPGSPGSGGPSHNDGVYILSAIVFAVVGWAIGQRIFADPPPPSPVFDPSSGPGTPPPPQQVSLPGSGGGGGGTGGGSGGGGGGGGADGGGGGGGAGVAPLRSGFNLPPAGETRFLEDQVLADSAAPNAGEIAARHGITCFETVRVRLTGHTLHRCRRDGNQTVVEMIRALATERQIVGAQPVYRFVTIQSAGSNETAEQYAPEKLGATEAHRLATGNRVIVALIDSGVDPNHPDLAGAIAGSYDAADAERPHAHGTGMAGAIASRGSVQGIAPGAELLTVRAFSANSGSAEGTTLTIIKGLDWAAENGARVVNMSFAGPDDPRLRGALAKANAKGMVLIAAAGNAGPTSPPLYPAADPTVIAVTATDATDALFSGANRGKYIAVAAPGVDVLVPAPDGGYQLTTGTSVAAAEVSGVVALLIERNPRLTPKDVRRILMRTAKHLGPRGSEREYGAGLVNALQAVTAATRSPGM
jgi:Subtilase family